MALRHSQFNNVCTDNRSFDLLWHETTGLLELQFNVDRHDFHSLLSRPSSDGYNPFKWSLRKPRKVARCPICKLNSIHIDFQLSLDAPFASVASSLRAA